MVITISAESHVRLIWALMGLLYCMFLLRSWTLRKTKYAKLSPRMISSATIAVTILMVTVLAAMTTWSLDGPYRSIVNDVQDAIAATVNTPGVNLNDIVPIPDSANATAPANGTIPSTPTVMEPPPGMGVPTSYEEAATIAKSTPTVMELPPGMSMPTSYEEAAAIAKTFDLVPVIGKRATPEEIAKAQEALNNSPSTNSAEKLEKLKKLAPAGLQIEVSTYELPVNARDHFESVWKMNFASIAVFYSCLWLAKMSFVVFYFEFAKQLVAGTRRLLFVCAGAIAVTYVFVLLVHFLWCMPIQANWDMDTLKNPGSCRAEIAPSVINSVLNVLTDLMLMSAGIAIIRSLNVGRNDFRAASLFIVIGCFTILVAIVRLVCLVVLMRQENARIRSESHGVNRMKLPVQESVIGYPEVEAILAAMATCLPALRVLVRREVKAGKSWVGGAKDSVSTEKSEIYTTAHMSTTAAPLAPPSALQKEIC